MINSAAPSPHQIGTRLRRDRPASTGAGAAGASELGRADQLRSLAGRQEQLDLQLAGPADPDVTLAARPHALLRRPLQQRPVPGGVVAAEQADRLSVQAGLDLVPAVRGRHRPQLDHHLHGCARGGRGVPGQHVLVAGRADERHSVLGVQQVEPALSGRCRSIPFHASSYVRSATGTPRCAATRS